MNDERWIRQLAARARTEAAPHVDVAGRVMAILRSRSEDAAADERPLAWVAAFATAIAVPMAFLGLAVWQTWTNPLVGLFINGPWGTL